MGINCHNTWSKMVCWREPFLGCILRSSLHIVFASRLKKMLFLDFSIVLCVVSIRVFSLSCGSVVVYDVSLGDCVVKPLWCRQDAVVLSQPACSNILNINNLLAVQYVDVDGDGAAGGGAQVTVCWNVVIFKIITWPLMCVISPGGQRSVPLASVFVILWCGVVDGWPTGYGRAATGSPASQAASSWQAIVSWSLAVRLKIERLDSRGRFLSVLV